MKTTWPARGLSSGGLGALVGVAVLTVLLLLYRGPGSSQASSKGERTSSPIRSGVSGGPATIRQQLAELQSVRSDKWIVLTTINMPTPSVIKFAGLAGWKVVVVGDLKTPPTWSYPNCVFLSTELQEALGYSVTKYIKYNSYARKNLGYLFAIEHGAKMIYESDDDNELIGAVLEPFEEYSGLQQQRQQRINTFVTAQDVANPYAYFGEPGMWPRGYPLNAIGSPMPAVQPAEEATRSKALIQQGLANGDPDVDAVYRLTQKKAGIKIDIAFAEKDPLLMPLGTMAPTNSQNTFFMYDALWATLIPQTTAFRVCDIWRGWWTQRLLWDIRGAVMYLKASVYQDRNEHDYLDDYLDEEQLYTDANRIVAFLRSWSSRSPTLEDRMVELAQAMVDENFWKQDDANLVRTWVQDLKRIGYKFPTPAVFGAKDPVANPLPAPFHADNHMYELPVADPAAQRYIKQVLAVQASQQQQPSPQSQEAALITDNNNNNDDDKNKPTELPLRLESLNADGLGEFTHLELLPSLRQATRRTIITSANPDAAANMDFSWFIDWLPDTHDMVMARAEGCGWVSQFQFITNEQAPEQFIDAHLVFWLDGVEALSAPIREMCRTSATPYVEPFAPSHVHDCNLAFWRPWLTRFPLNFHSSIAVSLRHGELFSKDYRVVHADCMKHDTRCPVRLYWQLDVARYRDPAHPACRASPVLGTTDLAVAPPASKIARQARQLEARSALSGRNVHDLYPRQLAQHVVRAGRLPSAGSEEVLSLTNAAGSVAVLNLTLDGGSSVWRNVRLQLTFDDADEPQVDVTAATFFGRQVVRGEDTSSVHGAMLGMTGPGAGNQGYCFFPMPFWRSLRVRLVVDPLPSTVPNDNDNSASSSFSDGGFGENDEDPDIENADLNDFDTPTAATTNSGNYKTSLRRQVRSVGTQDDGPAWARARGARSRSRSRSARAARSTSSSSSSSSSPAAGAQFQVSMVVSPVRSDPKQSGHLHVQSRRFYGLGPSRLFHVNEGAGSIISMVHRYHTKGKATVVDDAGNGPTPRCAHEGDLFFYRNHDAFPFVRTSGTEDFFGNSKGWMVRTPYALGGVLSGRTATDVDYYLLGRGCTLAAVGIIMLLVVCCWPYCRGALASSGSSAGYTKTAGGASDGGLMQPNLGNLARWSVVCVAVVLVLWGGGEVKRATTLDTVLVAAFRHDVSNPVTFDNGLKIEWEHASDTGFRSSTVHRNYMLIAGRTTIHYYLRPQPTIMAMPQAVQLPSDAKPYTKESRFAAATDFAPSKKFSGVVITGKDSGVKPLRIKLRVPDASMLVGGQPWTSVTLRRTYDACVTNQAARLTLVSAKGRRRRRSVDSNDGQLPDWKSEVEYSPEFSPTEYCFAQDEYDLPRRLLLPDAPSSPSSETTLTLEITVPQASGSFNILELDAFARA